MSVEAIEVICQKLGTTVDNILPSAIEFGLHDASFSRMVWIVIVIVSIIVAAVSFKLINLDSKKCNFDFEYFGISLFIVSLIAFIFGLFFAIYGTIELHYWRLFPEMKAYKMILGWIK